MSSPDAASISKKTSYNPLNWECTHKITSSKKYAATVLAVSCIAIVVAALMPYYPGVVYAYYSVFALATAVSLVGLMISLVRSEPKDASEEPSNDSSENDAFRPDET